MSAQNTLRIGSHPMNFSLFILRRRNALEPLAQERGWRVEWLDYPEGRHSGDFIASGEVDWVGTGSTPPIYSQVQGIGLTYVGASASRRTASALLVSAQSPLVSIDQLKGTRVASTVGSYTDHFLAKALHDHRLTYRDVEVLDRPGRSGENALQSGEVQAWVALEPLLSEALARGGVRTLGEVGDFIPNRSLFWARRAWVEQAPEQAKLVYAALAENDQWIADHIDEAAQIIAKAHDSEVDVQGWVTTLSQRQWGIEPANAQIVAEQKAQADLLYEAGLLSAPLETITGIDLSPSGAQS